MKKTLFFLMSILLTATSAHSKEITNPFYISPKGKMTYETIALYQKFHVKKLINGFKDYRTRSRFVKQDFSYGISPKVAILGTLSNEWKRKKFDNFGTTDKIDTNIDWSIGSLYDLYSKDNLYFQLKLLYLQEQTHHFGGAYKAFLAKAKTGYDLDYFLTYLGGEIELPIAQKKTADNNAKYDIYIGVYKNFKDIISFDTNIHYNYDQMYKSKRMNSHLQLNILITPQISIGGFFDYTFFDRGKNNAEANSHTIGGTFKFQF